MSKTQLQFFRCYILGFQIKFKHLVALINVRQTVLSFLRIKNLNKTIFLNLIGEPGDAVTSE